MKTKKQKENKKHQKEMIIFDSFRDNNGKGISVKKLLNILKEIKNK